MLNQCTMIGNLGADPETRSFQNGGKVCNFRIAVTEKWKDRNTGEKRERTEWVPVAIFTDGLVGVAEKFLRKGSKVLVQGQFRTRKWQDQSGNDRYSTEVVLQGFDAKLVLLDGLSERGERKREPDGSRGAPGGWGGDAGDDLDQDIPFITMGNVYSA